MSSPAFSPDGRYLAFIAAPPPYSGVSRISVLDLRTGEIVAEIGAGDQYFESVASSFDGRELITLANISTVYESALGALPEYREIQPLQLYRIGWTEERFDVVSEYRTDSGRVLGEAQTGMVHAYLGGVYGPDGEGVGPGEIADFCVSSHPFYSMRCQGDYIVSTERMAPLVIDTARSVPLGLTASGHALFATRQAERDSVVKACSPRGLEFSGCDDLFAANIGQSPTVDVWSGLIISGALSESGGASLYVVDPSGRSSEISFNADAMRGRAAVIEVP